jgi:hypothetical protein
MEYLLYPKIYYANHHSVKTEDKKCAYGDKGDDSAFDIVQ